MKKRDIIQRQDLSDTLGRLETFLCDQFDTEALWPLAGLEEEHIENFINALYRLAWECLAIHAREDMPTFPLYRAAAFCGGDFPAMIQTTRQLVQCCDKLLMEEYREITQEERETIVLLEQLHHAMIGHYYFQHPGMDTVGAHEVKFRK
jgi:hypothetical protein